jgi:histidyl-tRNA synthetase
MPISEEQIAYSISVAATLRKAGVSTMLYTEADALNKKLRFADRMGFAHVLIIGETEVEQNAVNLKDMKTGASSVESLENVLQIVSNR